MEKGWFDYVVEMTEADMGNVMCHLDELGAWMQDLKNCAGTMRLRFCASEANLRGFDEWLKLATNGTGTFYVDPHSAFVGVLRIP